VQFCQLLLQFDRSHEKAGPGTPAQGALIATTWLYYTIKQYN